MFKKAWLIVGAAPSHPSSIPASSAEPLVSLSSFPLLLCSWERLPGMAVLMVPPKPVSPGIPRKLSVLEMQGAKPSSPAVCPAHLGFGFFF